MGSVVQNHSRKIVDRAARRRYALLSVIFLTACQVERNPLNTYTTTGENLGVTAFRDVALADSKVSFVGDDPTKRREAQNLKDRYSERITFRNNATMYYRKLFGNSGFSGAWTDADSLQSDIENSTFYKDRAIVFDRAKLHNGGYYTYLAQSSPTHNCFVFRGTFGDTGAGRQGNRGNQEVSGSICFLTQAKTLDELEREMKDLLARAQFDDGAGNRARPASAPLAGAAASAAIGVPNIGDFVTCYSSRLDSLYHARLCGKSDATVGAAETASIVGRLQTARRKDASTGGAPFAPAPPGTIVYTNDGYIAVVATDDMLVTTINAAGAIDHRFGLLLSTPIERDLDARAAERIWPLAVGKETTLVLSRDSQSWRITLKVLRIENVTLPAGTFETYVVERHDQGMGSNYYEGIRTFWYAPSTGTIVKFDYTHKAGTRSQDLVPWEAVRIVRPSA
jgi:hypothetical protein